MSKDYYKTLNVNKDASKDEIKKAFRVLAHKYHPDKNNGDDSKFKEVNEAYQVLSDDKKRSSYDRFGTADMGGFGGGQNNNWGGFDFTGSGNGVEFDMGDLGDIFGDFFGGGMGRRQNSRKGSDLSTQINLSFEESIFGVKKEITLNKQSVCDICDGTGAEKGSKMDNCKSCGGAGQIKEIRRSILGSFSSVRVCDSCLGKGKVPVSKCSSCKGSGVRKREEKIEINIPAGVEDGEMLRINSMGEAISGGKTGDLYIKVNVKPHNLFKRSGSNLLMNLNIKLSESILGASYDIETLEEKKLNIKIPEGVKHGELLKIRGRGVPSSFGRGDIIIKILVDLPKPNKKIKEAMEMLRKEGF